MKTEQQVKDLIKKAQEEKDKIDVDIDNYKLDIRDMHKTIDSLKLQISTLDGIEDAAQLIFQYLKNLK